jgi:hypothetical protein
MFLMVRPVTAPLDQREERSGNNEKNRVEIIAGCGGILVLGVREEKP